MMDKEDAGFGCAILALIGFLAALFYTSELGPFNYTIDEPLDVCPGTHAQIINQGTKIFVDYVNLNGDTVYLVYDAGRTVFIPSLKSKQVIAGEGCDR